MIVQMSFRVLRSDARLARVGQPLWPWHLASEDRNIPLFNMPSVLKYKKRYDRHFHGGPITSIAINSHGSTFAAGSLDGTASV